MCISEPYIINRIVEFLDVFWRYPGLFTVCHLWRDALCCLDMGRPRTFLSNAMKHPNLVDWYEQNVANPWFKPCANDRSFPLPWLEDFNLACSSKSLNILTKFDPNNKYNHIDWPGIKDQVLMHPNPTALGWYFKLGRDFNYETDLALIYFHQSKRTGVLKTSNISSHHFSIFLERLPYEIGLAGYLHLISKLSPLKLRRMNEAIVYSMMKYAIDNPYSVETTSLFNKSWELICAHPPRKWKDLVRFQLRLSLVLILGIHKFSYFPERDYAVFQSFSALHETMDISCWFLTLTLQFFLCPESVLFLPSCRITGFFDQLGGRVIVSKLYIPKGFRSTLSYVIDHPSALARLKKNKSLFGYNEDEIMMAWAVLFGHDVPSDVLASWEIYQHTLLWGKEHVPDNVKAVVQIPDLINICLNERFWFEDVANIVRSLGYRLQRPKVESCFEDYTKSMFARRQKYALNNAVIPQNFLQFVFCNHDWGPQVIHKSHSIPGRFLVSTQRRQRKRSIGCLPITTFKKQKSVGSDWASNIN